MTQQLTNISSTQRSCKSSYSLRPVVLGLGNLTNIQEEKKKANENSKQLYEVVWRELTRQIRLECTERGVIMDKIFCKHFISNF